MVGLNKARALLRSQSGAFDLPSIAVGVVVTVILGVGAIGVFVGLLPMLQDSHAKVSLNAVAEAQRTALSTERRYLGHDLLIDRGYLNASSPTVSVVGGLGTCYVAATQSTTGRVYYAENGMIDPQRVQDHSTLNCTALEDSEGNSVAGLEALAELARDQS